MEDMNSASMAIMALVGLGLAVMVWRNRDTIKKKIGGGRKDKPPKKMN